jgi:hypothetical protein
MLRLSGWGTEAANGTDCFYEPKTKASTSPIEALVSYLYFAPKSG